MGVTAAVVGGSALVGAGASMYSADKAAGAQKKAANQANDTQMHMFEQTQDNLRPYMESGVTANNMLMGKLPDLSQPVIMDQAALENTPGYQFTRDQGLKAVQNSAAARGLGVSGAAYKGAANYATGLADSTYQNQFNNAVTNAQNTYNRLTGVMGVGENAAAGVGNAAMTTGTNMGNNMVGAGNAQAASNMAMGNAVATGANGVTSGYMTNKFMDGMYGNNKFAGGASGWTNPDTGFYNN